MNIILASDSLYAEKSCTTRILANALSVKNNVKVILPYYEEHYKRYNIKIKVRGSFVISLPYGNFNVSVYSTKIDGIECYFIWNQNLFSRERMWGYRDDAIRSAIFCNSVLEIINQFRIHPDYLYTDSENTALIPIYLKFKFNNYPEFKNVKSYHYINSKIYRRYSLNEMQYSFGISEENGKIFIDNGSLNLTKAAIVCASRIFVGENAVSMLYSHSDDIHHTAVQFGFKIRKLRLGIDYNVFSPEKDTEIHKTFDTDSIANKNENKIYVQKHLCLEANENIPMLILYPDNNNDILTRVLHDMMKCDMQIIVVSEHGLPKKLLKSSNKVICINDCSSQVQRNVFSAADIALFGGFNSPCGNPAYIAAAYGCVPIVPSHRFFDYGFSYFNKLTYDGNGFTYDPNIPQDLIYTLWDALGIYRHDKKKFIKLIKNTMNKAFPVSDAAKKIEAETEKTLYSFI